jgi:hypothetical protein
MSELAPWTTHTDPIPAFVDSLPEPMTRAVQAWLLRTPSPHTRRAYRNDLDQFLGFAGIEAGAWEMKTVSPVFRGAGGSPVTAILPRKPGGPILSAVIADAGHLLQRLAPHSYPLLRVRGR